MSCPYKSIGHRRAPTFRDHQCSASPDAAIATPRDPIRIPDDSCACATAPRTQLPSPVAMGEGPGVRELRGARGRGHRLAELLPRLEPTALQRQGAQHLPPRLDQVEVGRVRRLEDELPAGMGQAPRAARRWPGGRAGCPPRRRPAPRWARARPRPAPGTPPSWRRSDARRAPSAPPRRGDEGAEDVAVAATPVVDLLRGASPACRAPAERTSRCPGKLLPRSGPISSRQITRPSGGGAV